MNQSDGVFQRVVAKLLAEILDGPPADEAYIVNPGDPGLLRQLGSLSAETVSMRPIPGHPSIAAHVAHLQFGFSLLARWIAGEENPWAGADWNAAWRISTVSADEWRALLEALRRDTASWQTAYAARSAWDDVTAAGALSCLAHTAYHMGAIRQILAAARA